MNDGNHRRVTMTDKKVIAVVGATGAQGGGLARAILADPNGGFACRAITRDPNKDKAQDLAGEGAEVVKADLDDLDTLKKAFAGAYGAYCVTNFWEHFSGEKEKAQAKNMAEAASTAGLKHVIWSTLEDTRKLMAANDTRMPILQEKYRVPHFDAKAEANAYFAGLPVTYLVTSFYWDNLYAFGMGPKKGDDGVYTWTFPMGNRRLSGMAVEDIGKAAYGIFKAGQRYINRSVGIVGEDLTFDEMSEKLSKGLNIPVKYNAVEADVYRGFGFPSADELGNMFQVYRDFEKEVLGARSIDVTRSLNPSLQTFDQWLARNESRISLALGVVGASRRPVQGSQASAGLLRRAK
jgi:uncharacterized protein YbjT (DUF2867 family)